MHSMQRSNTAMLLLSRIRNCGLAFTYGNCHGYLVCRLTWQSGTASLFACGAVPGWVSQMQLAA